jgi:hypothetical protein
MASGIPAAAYVRMSGRTQDKSPAEQRGEITKLAAREGFAIAECHWFTDEAITGDNSTDARAGLAALLHGAQAGTFKMVLARHTNRISREDPMDAIVFYNQLRKAGVGLHTCCEGAIDLEDFTKQLLPCTDPAKIEAVWFAFQRFDTADLGVSELAREMERKGYSSPTGKGWTRNNVAKLLRTTAYVGTSRWGRTQQGNYFISQGEDIVPLTAKAGPHKWRCKPDEDLIVREKASEGIIPAALFKRVQAKLKAQERKA